MKYLSTASTRVITSTKTILLTSLLTGALALLIGCATTQPPVEADPAILRVGITANAPPMVFKEGGQVVGVEAELAQALGRDLGRRVVFLEYAWEDLTDALVEGKVDILMSSMTITPARRYRIAFTNPYLKVGQAALVRADENYKYMVNLGESATKGVGVERGTTADQLIRKEFPRAKVKYYSSGDSGAEALISRNLDLYVGDSPMIWYLASRFESDGLTVAPMLLTEEYLGWGVRRTDDALLAKVNAFLLRAQESGELTTIMRRWMPGYR